MFDIARVCLSQLLSVSCSARVMYSLAFTSQARHIQGTEYLCSIHRWFDAARFSHGTDARALRYLARACYDDGRHKAARRTLLGATHLFPNDHTLRFNTGLSMQVGCARLLGGGTAAGLNATTQPQSALATNALRVKFSQCSTVRSWTLTQ